MANQIWDWHENGAKVVLSFRDQMELEPCDLLTLPGDFRGKEVEISGKGPVWFYAYMTYRAVNEGASSIHVIQQPLNQTVCVFRSEKGADVRQTPSWLRLQGGEEIEASIEAAENESPENLARMAIEWPLGAKAITITGRGANWMYAFCAAEAAASGIHRVACDLPREPGLITVGSDRPGMYLSRPRVNRESGMVLGVIGDPNSGKSVFSHILAGVLSRFYQKSWVYDCDHASPTPKWWMRAEALGVDGEVRALRDGQKRDWTAALEQRVAKDLGNLKANLDIVVADLPGGKHGHGLHERIPSGREVIMKKIDAFVLLGRADDSTIVSGWRAELRQHGLEGRVVAEIESADHLGAFDLFLERAGGLLQGRACGLDRSLDFAGAVAGIATRDNFFVRYAQAWRVAEAARSATALAFRTGSGGTCYGAAVLTRQQHIYRSGQYSSFNHSTNIHAEMGALLQAVMAGEPDVLVLALAKSKGGLAKPCGVCRQVMLEHAQRTGRDFDVAMLEPSGERYEIRRVSELLPWAWTSSDRCGASEVRQNPSVSMRAIPDKDRIRFGDHVAWECEGRVFLGMVWDATDHGGRSGVLVKLKYLQTAQGWEKLPHSFTGDGAYENFLQEVVPSEFLRFSGSVVEVPLDQLSGYYPMVARPEFPSALEEVLTKAGLRREDVFLTGSRATGMLTNGSDFDLVCRIAPEGIPRFRAVIHAALGAGMVELPHDSKSWRVLSSIFPGGGEALVRSGRYGETVFCEGQRYVFIFDALLPLPPIQTASLSKHPLRGCLSGIVAEADRASFKRSEFRIVLRSGAEVLVTSYLKSANLVKEGDHIAIAGCELLSDPDGLRHIFQTSSATDSLVWLSTAP